VPELSDLVIAVRDYLERHPELARETPSWLATTLWCCELVEWKPSQYHVAAALGELAAAQERKDAHDGASHIPSWGRHIST
jgi:hypothetical protein